jgi:hypothetical protein
VSETEEEILELRGRLTAAEVQRDGYAGQLAQIRASMATVSVYEGLVEVTPIVMMVAELAKDHEELEARIDAAIFTIGPDAGGTLETVTKILRGGPRFDPLGI